MIVAAGIILCGKGIDRGDVPEEIMQEIGIMDQHILDRPAAPFGIKDPAAARGDLRSPAEDGGKNVPKLTAVHQVPDLGIAGPETDHVADHHFDAALITGTDEAQRPLPVHLDRFFAKDMHAGGGKTLGIFAVQKDWNTGAR